MKARFGSSGTPPAPRSNSMPAIAQLVTSPLPHWVTQSLASLERHVRVRGGMGGGGAPAPARGAVRHCPLMRNMPGGQGGGGRNSGAGGGGGGPLATAADSKPPALGGASSSSAPSCAGRIGASTTRTTVLQPAGGSPSLSVAFSHASRLPASLVRSSFEALPALPPWPKISASVFISAD